MAVSLKHTKNVAKSDGVDTTVVQPSDWNAEHTLTAASGKVLGTATGATTVSELPIEVDATGQSVKLPSGITSSRPGSPGAGMVRYNTSTNRLEYYTDSAWKNVDNMTVSGTQPATAIAGDFWIDTASGNALKQYVGGAWVAVLADGAISSAKLATSVQQALAPAGSVMAYAGSSAPSGWLLCAGQEVSRTTYSALDAVIGTTYGAYTNGSGGVGTTHFRLPDLRGRVAAGKDDMGGTAASRLTTIAGTTLGTGGGSETHTLTTAQLPAHQHFVSNGVDSTGGLTSTNYVNGQANPGTNNDYTLAGGATVADRGLTSSTGSGSAHNNIQPTLVLNYIIKT